MLKSMFGTLAASLMAITMACNVTVVTPPQTTVKAENDLTAMSVDVKGATTNIDGIDLSAVTIGDVYFSAIDYGTTTASKVTNRSGDVTVYIDTAWVYTKVLGMPMPGIPFTKISNMTTTITPQTANTVVFDDNTAKVIFQALAKKKQP